MILSKNHLLHGQNLSADICIVGGGPAAISMAMQLALTSLKVIVIAGGGWSETRAAQDLHKGVVVPKGSHEPLEQLRRRQFGGASAVWSGRCVPYDPIDLKDRFWVPASGWPISYEEIEPYYSKASDLCQIGELNFNARQVFPNHQNEIIPGFDTGEIDSSLLERWSPPTRFAKEYRAELERSSTIHVLLDAHVLSFQMSGRSDRITHVEVAADKKRLTIEAAHFVLAAGGIENPRLLLSSKNEYFQNGLGNQHDNVGRYYMTHIVGTYAKINPYNRENIMFGFEKDKDVYCRRRWGFTEAAQEENRLMNTIFYLSHPVSVDKRGFAFTSIYNTAKLLVSETGFRDSLRKAAKRADYMSRGFGNFYNLGLPSLLPSKNSPYWGLLFQAEQTPNRESRVSLSDTERDAFGMYRAKVKIAFNDRDIESLVNAHNIFMKRFKECSVGEAVYTEEGLREFLKGLLSNYNSYAHHIGTTKMSDNPKNGVVDKNSKVFGIDNLFVASSSTFPTSSHANPTLTVVAQSLMLADHLKSIMSERTSSNKCFMKV
ncbi:GMC oxidoreductase [Pontibacter harenae]|uniref:GMC oxidoreductase n=1 Tax=Pontibacter harenae TaxID=2894083 RepID=UPI001E28A08E|nr:GMC family oxidoreductase [Pontibacter harenae]MCC9167527.1 GMC family oxidoreductase [Pontibacter harenae]